MSVLCKADESTLLIIDAQVRLMPATVTRLALGPIAADNVPVMVAEENGIPVSLLGQSFLSRFESVTIQGDTLLLR